MYSWLIRIYVNVKFTHRFVNVSEWVCVNELNMFTTYEMEHGSRIHVCIHTDVWSNSIANTHTHTTQSTLWSQMKCKCKMIYAMKYITQHIRKQMQRLWCSVPLICEWVEYICSQLWTTYIMWNEIWIAYSYLYSTDIYVMCEVIQQANTYAKHTRLQPKQMQ